MDKTLPPSLKEAFCFIKKFTDHNVECYFFELKELREFSKSPFFDEMKLFVGKNIVFESIVEPGTSIMRCKESQSSKLRQLWNYYILKKFNLK